MEFQTINLDMIDPNPNQPRKDFGDDTLQELAESIKQVGVLVPLLVRPQNGRYELVHGERRWRAAKMAGLNQVPARVQPLTDTEAFIISLNENLQRQNLNPIEEARAYRWLQDQGYTQEKIADTIRKSQQYVASRLTLLNLPEPVQGKITTHVVSASHGEVLALLKSDTLALKLAEQVARDKLTVRQLETTMREKHYLDDTAREIEDLGGLPKVKFDISRHGGRVVSTRDREIEFQLRRQKEAEDIKHQGYYISYWGGCIPKFEDNNYPMISKEEWVKYLEYLKRLNQQEKLLFDHSDIYWLECFERTREPIDGDLGEEVYRVQWGLREISYILPTGGWAWYDFPQEGSGDKVKIIRRRVFVPQRLDPCTYAKLLAVLSGRFCCVGSLAIYDVLSWVGGISICSSRYIHQPDDLVLRTKLMTALERDFHLSYDASLDDIVELLPSYGGVPDRLKIEGALRSHPDVFEHIRSMAKTMTESKRRMVMKQIGVNA